MGLIFLSLNGGPFVSAPGLCDRIWAIHLDDFPGCEPRQLASFSSKVCDPADALDSYGVPLTDSLAKGVLRPPDGLNASPLGQSHIWWRHLHSPYRLLPENVQEHRTLCVTRSSSYRLQCTVVQATSSVPHIISDRSIAADTLCVTTNFVIWVAGNLAGNQYSFIPLCPMRRTGGALR